VEALRRQNPKDAGVLAQVAEFYQRAKRYPEAESTLRQALELGPANWRMSFQLGAVLERQKRYDEAEALFRDALKAQPDSASVLNYLGYMNSNRNVRVAEALKLIERALTLDPESGAYLD